MSFNNLCISCACLDPIYMSEPEKCLFCFGLAFFGFVFDSFYCASRQEDLQQSGWKKDTLKLEKDVKNESLTEVVGWTDQPRTDYVSSHPKKCRLSLWLWLSPNKKETLTLF